MSKKRKFRKFASLVTSTVLPISLISAGNETTTTTPSTPTSASNSNSNTNNANPKKEKPRLSNEFPEYDKIAKEEIKKILESALGAANSYIDNEIAKLEARPSEDQGTEGSSNDSKSDELDYKQRLSRLTYLHILKNYLESNKAKMLEKPDDYEFTIIFPYVLSQNEKFDKGNVTYNGKEYTGVTLGKSATTNYVEAIKKKYEVKEDGVISIETKDEVNGLQKGKFQESIKQYGDKLLTSIGSIIYNEKDALEIEKDINLEFNTIGDKQGYTITVPKNYGSWEEYFKSRIRPRFIDFDLTANQETEIEEETEQDQEQPTENPTNPNRPPKGQPTEPLPAEPVDPEEQILAIPALLPNVKASLGNITKEQLKNIFQQYKNQYQSSLTSTSNTTNNNSNGEVANSEQPTSKEQIDAKEEQDYNLRRENSPFYFDNPYNTRYSYDVIDIAENSGKMLATVMISDRNDKTKNIKREYKIEIQLDTSEEALSKNYLHEAEIDQIKDQFGRLYHALGIDSKINYTDLKSGRLSRALFSMIAKAVDLNNSKDFDDKRNEINESYNNDFNSWEATSKDLWIWTLNELKNSKVNSLPYYELMLNAYEEQIIGFWGVAIEDQSEPYRAQIIKDWESQNFNLNVLNDLYNLVRFDLYKLNSIVKTSSFSLTIWYDSFIDSLTSLSKHERILNELTKSKDLNNETAKQDFQKYYEEAIEILNSQSDEKSNFLRDFGIFLLVIGGLSSLINLMVALIKFNKKTTQIKKLYLLIGITMAIVLIAGIVLLAVGLGVKGI
ncbi:MSC_0620 family F1-like ATPase-associated subunit [Mycoplasma sp. CSL10166]|uniref:MSC_0620 family F1-like ATPase-associated subunit n=1 Tax=Mycoplasma sp. CSL10166 TaxID=2813825 RepID=UPI00197C7103|nr:hypothetical protein [Mycoplasma sp. CSL10166]MBN4084452.1 hypothetical protein [Mycoplasma sp. CSL10166]